MSLAVDHGEGAVGALGDVLEIEACDFGFWRRLLNGVGSSRPNRDLHFRRFALLEHVLFQRNADRDFAECGDGTSRQSQKEAEKTEGAAFRKDAMDR